MTNKLILILGMHRSGTSAMSGCLFNAGYNFGQVNDKDLTESKKDNFKGHYENHDFIELSNNILKCLATNWHFGMNPKLCKQIGITELDGILDCPNEGVVDWPIDNFNLTLQKDFSEMVVDCKNRLDNNLGEDNNLVIKDPRASIILPVYIRSIIERYSEYELYVINMIRNDDDICLSLNKRDGFTIKLGSIVIEKYRTLFDRYRSQTEDKDMLDKNIKFLDINFEDLVKNPIDSMKLVENKFELDQGYSGNFFDINTSLRGGVLYPALDPSIFEVKYPNTDISGKVLGDNLGVRE